GPGGGGSGGGRVGGGRGGRNQMGEADGLGRWARRRGRPLKRYRVRGRAGRGSGVDWQQVAKPALAVPVALGRRLSRILVPARGQVAHADTFTTTVPATLSCRGCLRWSPSCQSPSRYAPGPAMLSSR